MKWIRDFSYCSRRMERRKCFEKFSRDPTGKRVIETRSPVGSRLNKTIHRKVN